MYQFNYKIRVGCVSPIEQLPVCEMRFCVTIRARYIAYYHARWHSLNIWFSWKS